MGFSANTVSQSAGIVNKALFSLVTNADAATDQTINAGFVPRIVRVVGLTDRITYEWYEGMTSDSAIKTVAAGTRTLETSDTIRVYATNAAAQAAGKLLGDVVLDASVLVASKSYRVEVEG